MCSYITSCCKTLHRTILCVTTVFFCTAFFLSWWRTTNQYATLSSSSNEHDDGVWVLVGGVTNQSAEFRTWKGSTLLVADNPILLDPILAYTFNTSTTTATTEQQQEQPQSLSVANLLPATQYYYALNNALIGRFRTAPNNRTNFTIATGGCAFTGSTSAVFDQIRSKDPDVMIHLGDFHYEDIADNDLERRLKAVGTVLASPPQSRLYRSTALVSMWDDHDWLGNNAAADTIEDPAAIATAREAYRLAFPHYPLGANNDDDTAGIYHAFTWGTVRFIVSDVRSESTAASIFSDAQRDWLQNEFLEAKSNTAYDYVIWITAKPWIGDAGSDAWSGHPDDRAMVSNWLVNMTNVLAVSADAHMLAFDDGSHTNYGSSSLTEPSFPILQAGPLDRLGSTKGGPFTEGCHAADWERNHQYSTISFEFMDDDEQCLHIRSYRYSDFTGEDQVFDRRLCGKSLQPTTLSTTATNECTIPSFSPMTQGILYTAVSLWGVAVLLAVWRVRPWPRVAEAVIVMTVGLALTLTLGAGMPLLRGNSNVDVPPAAILVLLQSAFYVVVVLVMGVVGRGRLTSTTTSNRVTQKRSQTEGEENESKE